MPKHTENFITKINTVRELLEIRFPNLDMQNLTKIMGKLAHYHYNRRKCIILGQERDIYKCLIENSYNPFTVYRWLLLERLPKEIKWQLKNRQISQKQAITLAFSRRKETSTVLASEIKTMGMKLLGGM